MKLGVRQTAVLQKTVGAHSGVGRPLRSGDVGAATAAQRGQLYRVWDSLAKKGLVVRGDSGTVPTEKGIKWLSALVRDPEAPKHKSTSYKRVVPATATGTAWPEKVVDADRFPFQPGDNSEKLGKKVLRGRWKGFPIYSLTLEERATCPRSCLHWSSCYMNNSPHAIRFRHGPELDDRIRVALWDLDRQHDGYVIRLHMSGDFMSVDYALLWRDLIELHPRMRVFGYTAHAPDSEIGVVIRQTRALFRDRWAVRHSGSTATRFAAITIPWKPVALKQPDGMVCPEQLGKKANCGDCTWCWEAPGTPILFVDHAFL